MLKMPPEFEEEPRREEGCLEDNRGASSWTRPTLPRPVAPPRRLSLRSTTSRTGTRSRTWRSLGICGASSAARRCTRTASLPSASKGLPRSATASDTPPPATTGALTSLLPSRARKTVRSRGIIVSVTMRMTMTVAMMALL